MRHTDGRTNTILTILLCGSSSYWWVIVRTSAPAQLIGQQYLSEDGESSSSSKLGTIKVNVSWRHYEMNTAIYGDHTNRYMPILQNTAVYERSKKMATHRVQLGDPGKVACSTSSRDPLMSVSVFTGYPSNPPITVFATPLLYLPVIEFCFHYANKGKMTSHPLPL